MEKEILSKIYDLKNLIETTIKTFDDFSYNKTYIINSLTQIEDWIKNYNNIINNDLKKNIKTENPDENANIELPSELKEMLINDLQKIKKNLINNNINKIRNIKSLKLSI